MERELAVDMMYGTPTFAAAFAVASSPSLCKIPCTPTGATNTGEGNLTPKRVVWEERVNSCRWKKNENDAYVKIAMGGVVQHTGDNAPLL
jgi:hypothetical protein